MRYLERDGNRIAYTRTGRGEAVLLIQGAGVVANGWRPQIDGLSERFDLLAFDNRGVGASSGHGPLSIEAMAGDALAILDAEGVERAHVVGHSMGGLTAQALVLREPARVASLSLLCTFATGSQGARFSLDLTIAGLRARVGTRSMRRQAFLSLVMPHAFLETQDLAALAASLAQLFGHDLGSQPWFVFTQLRAMSRFDARPRLATLGAIPTLVVSAVHDRIALPSFGRELAAAIPGARYVNVPDAGHAVPIQQPETINALIAEHAVRGRRGAAGVRA